MSQAPAVELRHTFELERSTLSTIRAMLDEAYDGEFADEDWEHTVGGVHALAWDGDELVGHGSVVQRRFYYTPSAGASQPVRVLRGGYVEGMAVRADRRRRGIGRAIMAGLHEVINGAYEIGGLSTSDEGRALYEALGWQAWRGRTFALTPDGLARTEEEDDGIYVLPVAPLDLGGDLACDWRHGDVW